MRSKLLIIKNYFYNIIFSYFFALYSFLIKKRIKCKKIRKNLISTNLRFKFLVFFLYILNMRNINILFLFFNNYFFYFNNNFKKKFFFFFDKYLLFFYYFKFNKKNLWQKSKYKNIYKFIKYKNIYNRLSSLLNVSLLKKEEDKVSLKKKKFGFFFQKQFTKNLKDIKYFKYNSYLNFLNLNKFFYSTKQRTLKKSNYFFKKNLQYQKNFLLNSNYSKFSKKLFFKKNNKNFYYNFYFKKLRKIQNLSLYYKYIKYKGIFNNFKFLKKILSLKYILLFFRLKLFFFQNFYIKKSLLGGNSKKNYLKSLEQKSFIKPKFSSFYIFFKYLYLIFLKKKLVYKLRKNLLKKNLKIFEKKTYLLKNYYSYKNSNNFFFLYNQFFLYNFLPSYTFLKNNLKFSDFSHFFFLNSSFRLQNYLYRAPITTDFGLIKTKFVREDNYNNLALNNYFRGYSKKNYTTRDFFNKRLKFKAKKKLDNEFNNLNFNLELEEDELSGKATTLKNKIKRYYKGTETNFLAKPNYNDDDIPQQKTVHSRFFSYIFSKNFYKNLKEKMSNIDYFKKKQSLQNSFFFYQNFF